jgi:hypothetical protein
MQQMRGVEEHAGSRRILSELECGSNEEQCGAGVALDGIPFGHLPTFPKFNFTVNADAALGDHRLGLASIFGPAHALENLCEVDRAVTYA